MSRKDWKDLSERQRWRAFDALAAGQPLDDEVVPAFLNLQRSRKREAVHLVWAGPLFFGPVTALGVGLAASRAPGQSLLPVALQASAVTLPLATLFFAAIALWTYSAADQRERQLRDQLGKPVEGRSLTARVARSVGRGLIAAMAGVFLSVFVMLPVRLLLLIVSRLGVPIDAVPEVAGQVVGGLIVAVVTASSYQWLRSNPSSPLRHEKRSGA